MNFANDSAPAKDRYLTGFAGPGSSTTEPTVAALRLLEKMVSGAREDRAHALYAETDMRVIFLLSEKLETTPEDPDAVKWLRQLAISWSSRLRGEHARRFRRIFELIEAAQMVSARIVRQQMLAA